jgi:hypothetical protein
MRVMGGGLGVAAGVLVAPWLSVGIRCVVALLGLAAGAYSVWVSEKASDYVNASVVAVPRPESTRRARYLFWAGALVFVLAVAIWLVWLVVWLWPRFVGATPW